MTPSAKHPHSSDLGAWLHIEEEKNRRGKARADRRARGEGSTPVGTSDEGATHVPVPTGGIFEISCFRQARVTATQEL